MHEKLMKAFGPLMLLNSAVMFALLTTGYKIFAVCGIITGVSLVVWAIADMIAYFYKE